MHPLIGGARSHKPVASAARYSAAMTLEESFERGRPLMRWRRAVAYVALLVALGGPAVALAQAQSARTAVPDTALLTTEASQDTTPQNSPGAGLPHRRKVTRQLGELEPVVEWQWGAILATALAMIGAILLTLPIALVYMWTKPADEYDPSVMHSSIILAPTIAGVLIVIQGSLAMAFSLAGVATAVRFRNSLKDTNDAVYVFVAVAIGLAAGGQALDIALAISTIFSAMVLLLSKSPFRITGNPQHPAHEHHRRYHHDLTAPAPSRGDQGGLLLQSAEPAQDGSPWVGYITVRASNPELARPTIEAFLDRAAKRWRLERTTRETDGRVTLLYAVRCRKRTPRDLLLRELGALAQSLGLTVEAVPVPLPGLPAVGHSPPGEVPLPQT